MKTKILFTIFFLALSLSMGACTYQIQTPSPTGNTGITVTSLPPSVTPPDATATLSFPVTEDVGPQPLETSAIEITPEVTRSEASNSAIGDPFAAVSPRGQRVFLWYFLPAQSPADQAFNQIIDLFNQSNPERIFIDAYNQSTATGVLTRTLPVLNTTDVPGLIMTDPDLVAFLDEGLQDLTPLVHSPGWGFSQDQQEAFSSKMLEQVQIDQETDTLLAFPLLRQAQVLYINSEWITELGIVRSPRSPQEIRSTACQARDIPMRRAGSPNSIGLLAEPGLPSFTALLQAFGGDLRGPDSVSYEVYSPAGIDALQFLQSLTVDNCAQLTSESAEFIDDFAQGRTALLLSSTGYLYDLQLAIASGLAFPWDAAGFPDPQEAQLPVVTTGLNFSIPQSTPEQIVAAWLFVRYFQTAAAQALWIPATGNIPLRPRSAEQADLPADFLGVLDDMDQALYIPALPGYVQVDSLVAEAMQDIAAGQAVEPRLIQLQAAIDEITTDFYSQQTSP